MISEQIAKIIIQDLNIDPPIIHPNWIQRFLNLHISRGISFLRFFKVILRDDRNKRRSINPRLSNGPKGTLVTLWEVMGTFSIPERTEEGRRKMSGWSNGRMNGFCIGRKFCREMRKMLGWADGRMGLLEGRRKKLGLTDGRMKVFCREKKKNFGLSRWKSERVLQREEERCWVEQMENEWVLQREEDGNWVEQQMEEWMGFAEGKRQKLGWAEEECIRFAEKRCRVFWS
jgi:hypothetical protein